MLRRTFVVLATISALASYGHALRGPAPSTSTRAPVVTRRAALFVPAAAAIAAASRPQPAQASLMLMGLAAKEAKRNQADCFEKMDCAEAVPAWDITCDRDDKSCLLRKRQLAQQDLKQFKENPGGAVGVVALLALRPILGLFRRRSE